MYNDRFSEVFLSISKHVKKNGVVSIHLYHKGNFIYEINGKKYEFIYDGLYEHISSSSIPQAASPWSPAL